MQSKPTLGVVGVLAVLVALGATSGCDHDLRVDYPAAAPGAETGSLTLRLTKAASNVTMTVNGVLVAEAKHTKKITVRGVPAGYADVMVAIGGGDRSRVERTLRVAVHPGWDTAIPIAAPEMSKATAIYRGLYLLGEWIFLASIYSALLL